MPIWLGLTRIGTTVALVNSHLSGDSLVHAINVAAPALVIVDPTSAAGLAAVRSALPASLAYWVLGKTTQDLTPIDSALLECLGDTVTLNQCPAPPIDSTALYIYTSGTTGLPKAARVSHRRIMQWSHWFAGLMDTVPEDRMYDCLPLYHSVGGIVATGATLVGGGTVVIRKRFSTSEFWRDIRDQRCTLFQYIGELCRYLVNAPADSAETGHSLRLACGNGLRAEVWHAFQARFRIPHILEYYAATEAPFSLYNCEQEPGAIGRIPPFLRHRMSVELLSLDPDSGEPWRDKDGFCRRCQTNEVGEAVGLGRFEGYTDTDASSRKILKHVFADNDEWYRTGDLMRCDARGFYYFVDRAGDTYRWKGENVATSEVLSVLMTTKGVLHGVVYGVSVPGTDGRAGMAAICVDSAFDLGGFHDAVSRRLPAYARPLFLRMLQEMPATSTFKPITRDMAREGFDPALIPDPLFFDSTTAGAYVALDEDLYAQILAGSIRL